MWVNGPIPSHLYSTQLLGILLLNHVSTTATGITENN